MFRRLKSLVMIVAMVTLVFGSNQLIIQAAANDTGEDYRVKAPSSEYASDLTFDAFYNRLLAHWNNSYKTNQGSTQETNNKNKEGSQDDAASHVGEEPDEVVAEKPNPEIVEQTEVEKEEPVEKPQEQSTDQENQLNAFEREMFELTNKERVNNGLAPLQIEYDVSKVAREKSRDMATNGYFDHNSPVYGSPFDMMRAYGISYRAAGENIAMGQRTPNEVVQAWMNSPGHRANILNPSFTHIGVGYVEKGHYWTQQFIGK